MNKIGKGSPGSREQNVLGQKGMWENYALFAISLEYIAKQEGELQKLEADMLRTLNLNLRAMMHH